MINHKYVAYSHIISQVFMLCFNIILKLKMEIVYYIITLSEYVVLIYEFLTLFLCKLMNNSFP